MVEDRHVVAAGLVMLVAVLALLVGFGGYVYWMSKSRSPMQPWRELLNVFAGSQPVHESVEVRALAWVLSGAAIAMSVVLVFSYITGTRPVTEKQGSTDAAASAPR